MEGETSSPKFQALLREYGKIKKQNTLLKNAVKDEKMNVASLEMEMKEKEMSHRKVMEENEILSFNNQRLTKRVTSLQQELSPSKNETSSWFSSGTKTELVKIKQSLKVTRQELSIKIQENEQLHMSMFELKKGHQQSTEKLQEEIAAMASRQLEMKKQMDSLYNQHEEEVKGMHNELQERSNKTEQLSSILERTKELMEEQQEANQTIQRTLQSNLMQTQDVIQRHVLIDDTINPLYNRNNLPPMGLLWKKSTQEKRSSSLRLIENLFESLSKAALYHKKRENTILRSGTLDHDKDLKSVHKSLEKEFECFVPILEKVKETAKALWRSYEDANLPSIQSRGDFILALKKVILHQDKLLSLQQVCLEYPKMNIPQVVHFVGNLVQLQRALDGVFSFASIIFYMDQCPSVMLCNQNRMLQELVKALRNLQVSYRKATLGYARVVEFEELTVEEHHKQANEEISKAMSSVVRNIAQFTNEIEYVVHIITSKSEVEVRGVKQEISGLSCFAQEQRAASFIRKLNKQVNIQQESVPYEVAIENARFIADVESKKENYEIQIKNGKKMLEKEMLEKENMIKEWAITKDLLAAKKDHVTSLLTELSETREKYKNVAVLSSLNMNIGDVLISDESGRNYQMKVIDEDANESASLQATKLDRERETAIKQHYQAKRTQLLAQMKIADEKAISFAAQFERTNSLLSVVTQENEVYKEQLERTQEQQVTAMADLESTRRNYEDQMKLMTEHFMTLNDKVGKQEDTISRLNNHKVHCARCGTWNTIAWLNSPDGLNGRRCSRGNHPSSYNYS